MTIRVIGICATPIKGEETNTEILLKATLDAAKAAGKDVATEMLRLADLNIKSGCTHCNWCISSQTAAQICAIDDDMPTIYLKIMAADAIVFATPVYIGRISWLLAAMIDRLRALLEGRHYGRRGPWGGVLADKVVAGCSVAWFRHGGVETALLNIMIAAAICDWIPVTGGMGFGVGGVSEAPLGQTGACRNDRHAMEKAQAVGAALVRMARIVKAGKEVLRDAPAYVSLR